MIADETRSLATHVQNLVLTFADLDDDLDYPFDVNHIMLLALSRCIHIQRLIVDYWDRDEFVAKQVSGFKTLPRPWDVRLPLDDPFYLLPIPSYLCNVTHFYCGESTDFNCEIGIHYSTYLPHVTHLAFSVADIWGDRTGRDLRRVLTFETLETWLNRPSLILLYVEYREWNKRFKNGVLDRNWNRMIAMEDERLFIGSGLDVDFNELTEDGISVWDRVRERFENWRVTVRDPEHTQESNDIDNIDMDRY